MLTFSTDRWYIPAWGRKADAVIEKSFLLSPFSACNRSQKVLVAGGAAGCALLFIFYKSAFRHTENRHHKALSINL